MKCKRIAALLLALAGIVCLPGCARLFVTEYRTTTPYVDPQPEEETTGEEIRSYAALTRALRGMVANYTAQGTLVFTDYDGIIADDLAKACWELRSGTALGAYCVRDITYETEQVVAYCEADVVITYKRSAEDVKSIYSAQTLSGVRDSVLSAMESNRRRFAIQMNSGGYDEGDIQSTLEKTMLTHPMLTVSIPEIEITTFGGETRQRIFEIRLDYPVSDDALAARRSQLAEAVTAIVSGIDGDDLQRVTAACAAVGGRLVRSGGSECTAYELLKESRGESRALAMALKAVCDALDIPCEIVNGQLDSYPHMWNIVEIDGKRYHVDLTGYAGTLRFEPDNVVWGRCWWNTEEHKPCTSESLVWTEDSVAG